MKSHDHKLPRMARQSLLVIAPLLIASTLPAQAGSTGMTGNARGSGDRMGDSTHSLVNLLAVANKDEIEAAKLALAKATRSDVKAYAQKLMDEHSKALRQLDDSATGGGWAKPDSTIWSTSGMMGVRGDSSMRGGARRDSATGGGVRSDTSARAGAMGGSSMHMQGGDDARMIHMANVAAMKKLNDASGANFDKTYLSTQVDGHATLLKTLEKHSTSNAKLQRMVAEMKTSVQEHLNEARKLQAVVGEAR